MFRRVSPHRASSLCAVAVMLALCHGAPAQAQTTDVGGYDALALAHMVFLVDDTLDARRKQALDGVALGAWSAERAEREAGEPFQAAAQQVRCRASNVAINAYSCDLTFDAGSSRAGHLERASARALFNLLRAQGVLLEGGAGSVFAEIARLKCDIDLIATADATGGGVHCAYMRVSGEAAN